MRQVLIKFGTNGISRLFHFLGIIDGLLLFRILLNSQNIDFYLWVTFMIWCNYLSTSRALSHMLMYSDGTFAVKANPPLKAGYYKWFFIFYIPQILFSLFLAIYLCFQGQILAAMAGFLLFALKFSLMRLLNQMFRNPAEP